MRTRPGSGLVVVLGFLLRLRRSLDRRQRLDVLGDPSAILRRQLRNIPDHARHRAAGAVAIGHLPALQEIFEVFHAPLRQPLLRDVGDPPLAFRIWPAGKALGCHDAAEEIPWAVTLRAMAKTVDEI